MEKFHKPVLLKEVLRFLQVKKGEKYIDATIGGGGHTKAILKAQGIVLGIDCDPRAISFVRKRLRNACLAPKRVKRTFRGSSSVFQLEIAQGNFVQLKEIAREHNFENVAGVLFDLGLASFHLADAHRGFSFQVDGPLDMRMDPSLGVTAADLINSLSKGDLDELFKKMADEKLAWPIAHAIIRARSLKPITRTGQLTDLIVKVYRKKGKFPKIHPATRVFQALRIVVNSELDNLEKALPSAVEILKPGGRLVIISFHSGEDRIVKQFLKESEKKGEVRVLTKKPVRPKAGEVKRNPRSRSACLRVGEKL